MEVETSEPHVELEQEQVETVVEEMQKDIEPEHQEQNQEKESEKVPLSALQKERKKRQALEQEIEWMKRQSAQPAKAPEEDHTRYEAATRDDLGKAQSETVRLVEEKFWVKQNPEKYERVNEYLPEFLKQRPHLAHAIANAPNRYEEAYVLMDALTPKQKAELKKPPEKRQAPASPTSVPKAAGIDQAIDVMSMSDEEYQAWRKSKSKRR